MLNKIKEALQKVFCKCKTSVAKTNKTIKWVVLAYLALVCLLLLTYYAAWAYLFFMGKATLPELMAIIQETIGTTMIAFVTFIAGCFVDLNNNGVPDKFEEEEEKTAA